MEKIGIIGQGFVGNAVYQKFKDYFEVLTYDIDGSKCNSTFNEVVYNCRHIFLCLPTPMQESGQCDTSIVLDVIKKIYYRNTKDFKVIILKSTVPPGFTKTYNLVYSSNTTIVFNPEFLTAVNAVSDFANQKWAIFGGEEEFCDEVAALYKSAFADIDVIITKSDTAEMGKYVINTFLATKVAFANEMYEFCTLMDIDYNQVINCVTMDERVGTSHWQVPGPDGYRGFGGACFPKDINALIYEFQKHYRKPLILSSVWDKNLKIRSDEYGNLIP